MRDVAVADFAAWRTAARGLLRDGVPPEEVAWREPSEASSLFADAAADVSGGPSGFHVPKRFVELADAVSCIRGGEQWALLYPVLWRLTHGEPHLLEVASDEQVRQLHLMEKAIRRDIHKMHAFVRFRSVIEEGEEWFVAWYRPDDRILKKAAPFFRERFGGMRWAILTPDGSVYWDQEKLQYGPAVARQAAPQEDELEDAWRTYYRSIYNPARVNVRAMRREMPGRFWDLLPETAAVPDLLRQSPGRVEQMIVHQEGSAMSALDFFPEKITLETLRKAASGCEGCDLYKRATQTVFGEGPKKARLMLVGEQPGDQEDKQGHPFVGPSGKLLDQTLEQAGIDRNDVYITNAVKHFSFTDAGPRRLHKKPTARQVSACVPWLEAEIDVVEPEGIVCLGATAAQALMGRDFRITKQRGQIRETPHAKWILATYHPSALLRAPDPESRERMMAEFLADLTQAAKRL